MKSSLLTMKVPRVIAFAAVGFAGFLSCSIAYYDWPGPPWPIGRLMLSGAVMIAAQMFGSYLDLKEER